MPQWQGKSKGAPLGYQIFVWICKHLGLMPAYGVLYFVAGYYFLFSPSSSKHSYSFFKERLGYTRLKSYVAVYKNYYLFGQTLLDKIVVMANIKNPFTFNFDGEFHLHSMVAAGKGGILLSAHVGNWEAAGHLLTRLNTVINVVMYDAEHEKIKAYLEETIGARNFNVIVIDDTMSHVYKISHALQNNELVCMHADRFLEGNKTIQKNFLGNAARFPLGPFQLAAGFKAPVSIVFAMKESSTHYHFYGSELLSISEGEDKRVYTDRLINTFVSKLEEKVKQYPLQWFNYFNFWSKE
jgi:predicted LPLAT superfamily acyltransferase